MGQGVMGLCDGKDVERTGQAGKEDESDRQ